MTKKDLIIKDNTLINASYTLNLTEQRLLLLSISKAQNLGLEINHNDYISLHAEDFTKKYDVSPKLAYRDLKNACDSILSRVFSYSYITKKGLKAIKKSNWLQSAEYIEGEGVVKILFTKELIPFINQLKQRFTSYFLTDVSKMTSVYAIRLYELVIAWRTTYKTPIFSLQDFREKLGVESGDYPRMYDFKRRVLDVAVNQINELSNIKIEVIQHKAGRSISGFSFTFEEKDKKKSLSEATAGHTKKRRKKITKQQAEKMAKTGESWEQLLKRISSDFIVMFNNETD